MMPHHFKHAFKHRTRHNMNKFFRNEMLRILLEVNSFHEFVGILRFNLHEPFHKVMVLRSIGRIQQQLECFKIVINKFQHLIHSVIHIFIHDFRLFIGIHRMKVLLCFQKHLNNCVCCGFYDRTEQSLLIPKSGINRTGGCSCLCRNAAKGRFGKSILQKFLLCTR